MFRKKILIGAFSVDVWASSQLEFKVNVEVEPGLNGTRLGFSELRPDPDLDLDLNLDVKSCKQQV